VTVFAPLADPAVFAAVAGVFGLLIGSFLNVVIHRLPIMMERDWAAQCAEFREEAAPVFEPLSLMKPRSRCPHCGHAISALENIPVISWLFLRGRCRGCKAAISPRYPLVELATGVIFAALAYHFGFGLAGVTVLGFAAALIALTGIDIDTQLLPDDITLPLMWAGLLVNISGTFVPLKSAVIGAVAGYLALWCVYWGFKIFTGKEGMGYGDFKLLAALGAWLGWEMLPLTILLSSAVGAAIGLVMIALTRRGRNVPIPFGPYLAIAGLIALIWGKPLTQAYLGTQL
jgi:leader peptidase (prepilin peptidase) / N-methyltransferase